MFDAGGRQTFRHQLYREYKATRERFGEVDGRELSSSIKRVREILECFRIPAIEVSGFEADDVIGTLAIQAAQAGLQAVIVSGDSDFYQLIGERIAVLEPGRGGRAAIEPRWIDAAAALERMGVPPDRVTDYLALTGDASDNVPGVKGSGTSRRSR